MSGAPTTDKTDVRDWWTENPMTYGDTHGRAGFEGQAQELGSVAFFEALDKRFYGWNTPLHGERPFSRLFPYDRYGPGARVLEIGCGLGTMAMNWARTGVAISAVDLNPTSIAQTRRRFELNGLAGDIRLMDGNSLDFEDGAFDYVYSWGVLHHSPDLALSLREMMRVLKPGGGFGLMLYNRESILHRYLMQYVEGFLHYENRFLGPLALASRYGDGDREEGNPHTWPVTRDEVHAMVSPYAGDIATRILGTDLDSSFQLLLPGLGLVLPAWLKKPWARRFGWSLWTSGHKR